MPRPWTTRAKALLLGGFVLLAGLPDWPLPGWGHHRYLVSHSLFVNLAIMAVVVAGLACWKKAWRAIGGTPVVIGAALAWLSHFSLDSFYNHGQGIAIYWPFSGARLALPMPWFSTLESMPPPLNAHTVRVCLIELAFYCPFLLLAIYWRRRRLRKLDGSVG